MTISHSQDWFNLLAWAKTILDKSSILLLLLALLIGAGAGFYLAQSIVKKRRKKAELRLQAMVSHEIRTPLSAIVQLLSLARNPEQLAMRELIDAAFDSAQSLLTLLDDLLIQSKLDAGQFSLNPQPVDLLQLQQRLRDIYTPIAAQKNIAFNTHTHCAIRFVRLDALRLQQILGNLLSNAIKFTPTGYISLSILSMSMSPDRARIIIEVSDSGLGIEAAALQSIFTPFSARGEAARQQYGGFGLGLSLVKQLTELMGGVVSAESQSGQGTKMTLVFECQQVPSETFNCDQMAFCGARVLLVDDSLANQMLFRRQLEQLGLTVECCSNGQQGLRLWAKTPFDIIFCDMHMPGMSGFELVNRIRHLERRRSRRKVPIVAISGDPEVRQHLAGIDRSLVKPATLQDLQLCLYGCLSSHQADFSPLLRVDALYQLSQGDKRFEVEFLQAMLQNNREDLKNLQTAYPLSDKEKMLSALHRLVSISRLMCTSKITQHCISLEHAIKQGRRRQIEALYPLVMSEMNTVNNEVQHLLTQ